MSERLNDMGLTDQTGEVARTPLAGKYLRMSLGHICVVKKAHFYSQDYSEKIKTYFFRFFGKSDFER
jgi:hypothetical protein